MSFDKSLATNLWPKKPSFLQLEGLQKFVNHSPAAHDVQTILLLSQHPAFGISKAFIWA